MKKKYARHNFENCIVILEAKVNFYHGVMNSSNIKLPFKVGNVTRSTQIIF